MLKELWPKLFFGTVTVMFASLFVTKRFLPDELMKKVIRYTLFSPLFTFKTMNTNLYSITNIIFKDTEVEFYHIVFTKRMGSSRVLFFVPYPHHS